MKSLHAQSLKRTIEAWREAENEIGATKKLDSLQPMVHYISATSAALNVPTLNNNNQPPNVLQSSPHLEMTSTQRRQQNEPTSMHVGHKCVPSTSTYVPRGIHKTKAAHNNTYDKPKFPRHARYEICECRQQEAQYSEPASQSTALMTQKVSQENARQMLQDSDTQC